jgi:hypothetical protein
MTWTETVLLPNEIASGSLAVTNGDAASLVGVGLPVPHAGSIPTSESGGRSHSGAPQGAAAVTAGEDGLRGCESLIGTAALPGSLTDGPDPTCAAVPCACVGSVTSDIGPDPLWSDDRTLSVGAEHGADGDDPVLRENRISTAVPTAPPSLNGRGGRASSAAPSATTAPSSGPDLSATEDRVLIVGSVAVEGVAIGPNGSAIRDGDADLDLLHSLLSHYSRELLDIQKLRVAQGNRVAAMERDGLPDEFIAFARDTLETLDKKERALGAYLGRQAKRHPLGAWITEQRGIGLPGFARLVGITGPLDRFATVSKLWAYLGMHTVSGLAARRKKGEKANWSGAGRVLCYQIGESIVKMGKGGEYREAYDRIKARYAAEHPDWTPGHRHAAARRYAVKLLLKRMWLAYRRVQREAQP